MDAFKAYEKVFRGPKKLLGPKKVLEAPGKGAWALKGA